METSIIEKKYPIAFRKDDAEALGKQLAHRHSVDLIGMKRVGISNFLRYFLNHKEVVSTYIHPTEKYLFIPVDLNDLVERELFPFWALTMKRIVDAVSRSEFTELDKKQIESLFLSSIQTQDLFLLIDSVRRLIEEIVSHEITPVLFFPRFDRMKDVVTPSFFDNLQGLKDASHQKLVYVFTGFRSLDVFSPKVFQKASLSVFCQSMFIKPAKPEDAKIIYETYRNRYNLSLLPEVEAELLRLANGYVQYLQLALIILNEKKEQLPQTGEALFALLSKDERIMLQSEELWESLTKDEKEVVMGIVTKKKVSDEQRVRGAYLWDCGFVLARGAGEELFSELFLHYIRTHDQKQENQMVHFSKKEHLLYTLLEQHVGQICEREKIVETVWPEYSEFGVSDWAIDRLVARVRSKLKQQKSHYEIVTIRTRGYKLAPLE
ncbi:MAG: helix-turn-helix domain-containing protein [bacterium]|nr:helix-turn-helix domain-containing protein [bacterium]